MTRRLGVILLSGCAALCLAPAAFAAPGARTFAQTYPIASRLCAEAQSGQLPKGVQASSAQLQQACTSLQASFSSAQATVVSTTGKLKAQLRSDRARLLSACQQARRSHTKGACLQARQTFRTQAQSLRGQLKAANQQFFAAVEAARKTFWSTVHSLRGGKHIKGDAPIKPTP